MERAVTEVAPIPMPVPRVQSGFVRWGSMPPEQFFRDDAARVLRSNKFVNLVTVKARSTGATSHLKVVAKTGGRSILSLAKRAFNVSWAVKARVEVHSDVVNILEGFVAICTVQAVLNLVLISVFLVLVRILASGCTTLVRIVPMSRSVHVLLDSTARSKETRTGIALECGNGVTSGV